MNMDTGLFDKNGTPIKVGARTRLVLDDGEEREFEVRYKTVNRTTVKTLPGFKPETAEVSITGIFFRWEGHDLLPCVDENGVSDVSKMEVIRDVSEVKFAECFGCKNDGVECMHCMRAYSDCYEN